MVATRRFARSRGSRVRPQYIWGHFGTGEVTLAASGKAAVNMSGVLKTALPSLTAWTLERLIFQLHGRDNGTVTESLRLANFGITILAESAFDAGVTAMPDPENDDVSWLFWYTQVLEVERNERAAGDFRQVWNAFEFDIHSRRRVPTPDQLLVGIWKNRSAIAAVVSLQGQFLARLH